MSYILKAHVNFSSAVPELLRGLARSHWAVSLIFREENYLVTWRANMNSLKSIVPLRSVSNVLKMISLNLSAQPPGNILLYISTNWVLVSSPSGQSSIKPTCHSWGKITQSILNCPPQLLSSKILKSSETEFPGQTRSIDPAVCGDGMKEVVDGWCNASSKTIISNVITSGVCSFWSQINFFFPQKRSMFFLLMKMEIKSTHHYFLFTVIGVFEKEL